MRRKIVQIELDPREYSRIAAAARKKRLTIGEAVRQAALQWTLEESGIDPKDPIFHAKAQDWGKGTENVARDHDRILYPRNATKDDEEIKFIKASVQEMRKRTVIRTL